MKRHCDTRSIILTALPALLLAGCFSPSATPAGYSCSDADDRCPAGQVCVNNICVDKTADGGADRGMDKGADRGVDKGVDRGMDMPQDMPPHDLPQGDLLTDDLPQLDIKLPDLSVPDLPGPDASATGCTPPTASASCVEDMLGHSWCRIPAGCFTMGSPTNEPCRESGSAKERETQHAVTLTRSFEMAATEVTQGQFMERMGSNPSKFSACGDRCPVETVSWPQARAHCNQLSKMKGLGLCYACTGSGPSMKCPDATPYAGSQIYACPGYRLPAEAEFEYAYRAGTQTAYYNGPVTASVCGVCDLKDVNANAIAWHCGNASKSTHPVGGKFANDWGLYDMAGNVQEWVQDGYTQDLGSQAAVDPLSTGTKSMARGGPFDHPADGLRAARRSIGWSTSHSVHWNIGFRCARTREAGLLHHWKLDGGSSQATDSKGGYHGKIVGTKTATGVLGKARDFNGTSDRIETPFTPQWQSTDSFTAAAWIRTTTASTDMVVFGFEATKKGSVWLQFSKVGEVRFRVQDDGFKEAKAKSTAKLLDGNWHHLVGVRDGAGKELLLYVDGKLEHGTIDPTGSVINAASKLKALIGASNHNGTADNHFNGSIDDVRVYNRALYPGEVLELYKQRPCEMIGTPIKDLPEARRLAGSTEVVNGKLYILGGTDLKTQTYKDSIYEYDVWTNSYTKLAYKLPYGMNLKPYNIARHSDGKFYISPAISSGSSGSKNKVVVFDPVAKSATETGAFPSTVWDMAVASGGNGKLYFFGGSGTPGKNIWEYDPKVGKPVNVATMPVAGNSVSAAVLASNGKIYVLTNGSVGKLVLFDPASPSSVTTSPQSVAATYVAWEHPRGTLRSISLWATPMSLDLATGKITSKTLAQPVWGSLGGHPMFAHTASVDRGTGSLFAFGGEAGPVWPLKNAYRLDCLKW